jgi:hypothetical protein
VGYGDLTIKEPGTTYFLNFYIIVSTILVAIEISSLTSLSEEFKLNKQIDEINEHRKSFFFLANLNAEHSLNKHEFVI